MNNNNLNNLNNLSKEKYLWDMNQQDAFNFLH